MKFKILILALITAAPNVGSASCFRSHLEEAMALNRERLPRYSAITEGKSEAVSKALLRMEGRMLVYQLIADFDRASRPYDAAGIPLTCEAYVSMSTVTGFVDRENGGPIDPAHLKPVSLVPLLKPIWQGLRKRDFGAVRAESLRAIEKLSGEPRVNCLTRHFLESIGRIAALAPDQDVRARAAGLPSPSRISWNMIRGHLVLMPTAAHIDRRAIPIQQMGVPIICQDIPVIPIP